MSRPPSADRHPSPEDPSGPPPTRPGPHVAPSRRRRWVAGGLVLAAVVVVLAAVFASPDPDGLERVAEDLGFLDRAVPAAYHLIPDYALPGIGDPLLATIGAGLLGLGIVFGIVVGLGFLIRRRSA